MTVSWRGETQTLWQYVQRWREYRRFLRRLRRSCETGKVDSGSQMHRSVLKNLGLSALALGSFALWLGWLWAILLAVIILLHELGHWLAMRLTGQPAPRIALVPFFGGVAVANHPHKSRFDDAFCALMGPGFSAFLCVAAFYFGGLDFQLAKVVLAFALVVGILNASQLLPVLPLDGGQIVRATLQSFTGRWAQPVLLDVAALGIAAFAHLGNYLAVALLCLGALQAWHLKGDSSGARPMTPAEFIAVTSGYGAVLAVHVGAVIYGAEMRGIDLFGVTAAMNGPGPA